MTDLYSLPRPEILKFKEEDFAAFSSVFQSLISSPFLSYSDSLKNIYSIIHSIDFAARYDLIVSSVLDQLQLDCRNVLVQKKPTARLQFLNEVSVPFHIDKWSGHPKSLLNIWIPLTPLQESTSLHLLPNLQSSFLINEVENGNLSLSALSKQALTLAQPFVVPVGSFMVFNNNFLHGTVSSQELQPRVSLDFRIALNPLDIGNKKLNVDYVSKFKHQGNFTRTEEAHSVVYAANCYSNLGHNAQRTAINEFAIHKNLSIISEASEFVGCRKTPQIDEYLDSSKGRKIICFSRHCFSRDQFAHLKSHSNANQKRIFFALEGICLCDL